MKKIKKQNPKTVGYKSRKIKWDRSKDVNGMPYASCELAVSDSCGFWVLCEVMWLESNIWSFYIDSPGYSSREVKVRGFENAVERAEKRILSQVRKAHEQLARWI